MAKSEEAKKLQEKQGLKEEFIEFINRGSMIDLAVGVAVATLEGGHARRTRSCEVRKLQLAARGNPCDVVAIDIQAVVGVDIGAVVVALLVVAEHHPVLGSIIAHRDAGVAYRVVLADIESPGAERAGIYRLAHAHRLQQHRAFRLSVLKQARQAARAANQAQA